MPHPNCTGAGDADGNHCCYLGANEDGTQRVCEFLRIDDPRAPGRHFACGLFLEIKDRFPNRDAEWIWNRVVSDPRYVERIKSFLDARGLDQCPVWRGVWREDGNCHGQCCHRGWVWDANNVVIAQP